MTTTTAPRTLGPAPLIQYWRDGRPAGHAIPVTDWRDAASLIAEGERGGYHVLVTYPRTETERHAS